MLSELDISEYQIKQNNFSINPVYFGSNPTTSYNAYTQVIVKSPENIDDVTSAVREVDNTFV